MQDGNIAEAVVWQCGPSARHHAVDHVMLYALQRHLGSDSAVAGHASLLDAAMLQRDSHLDEQATARRFVDHKHTIGSFWQLCSIITRLDDRFNLQLLSARLLIITMCVDRNVRVANRGAQQAKESPVYWRCTRAGRLRQPL